MVMADSDSEPGGPPATAADAVPEQAARLVTEVTEGTGEPQTPRQRRRLAAALETTARTAGRGMRATGRGMRTARRGVRGRTGWLAAQVVAMAPRLRVRDQAALQAQFPGRQPDQIADALIEGASRASAAVGGAVGAWAALPVLPAFPAEVVTETLALVGIEIKLVAELHEAYGMPAPGNTRERMSAYVAAWAHRRGVSMVPGGLLLAAGSPLARRLRWRLAARVSRSAFSLGPLFTGAIAGAVLNRRETRRLGHEVRRDLRRHAPSENDRIPAWARRPLRRDAGNHVADGQAQLSRMRGDGQALGVLDRPGRYFHRCRGPAAGRHPDRLQAAFGEPGGLPGRGAGRDPQGARRPPRGAHPWGPDRLGPAGHHGGHQRTAGTPW